MRLRLFCEKPGCGIVYRNKRKAENNAADYVRNPKKRYDICCFTSLPYRFFFCESGQSLLGIARL